MLRTLCASPQWLWGCACLLGGLSVPGPRLVPGSDLGGSADLRLRDRPVARVVTFRASRSPPTGGVVRSGDHRGRPGPARSVDRHSCGPRRRPCAPAYLLLAAIPTSAVGLAVFVVADRADRSWSRIRQLRGPLFGVAAGLLYGVAGLGLKSAATFVQRWLIGSIPHLVTSPSPPLRARVGVFRCCVGRRPLLEKAVIDARAPGRPFPHFWEEMFGSGTRHSHLT